ncbi:zinc finger BED domain-containing protein DAYSLEEPER-like protein [Tanacetum coccineum]
MKMKPAILCWAGNWTVIQFRVFEVGTSHLKRHIAKGGCPLFLQGQAQDPSKISLDSAVPISDTSKPRYRTPSVPVAFDSDRCRHEIARMIILHDYPLHMVEHKGFMTFVHNLQPKFNMVDFSTVQGDCVATYLRENEWNIHKKLLNVVMEPYPESDSAFAHAVSACLSDWNIEGRLFSVTLNQNQPVSEIGINSLRSLLSEKNSRILDGQLLLTNCLARSLTSIAQEALQAGLETVKKVRDCVKYVKTSELIEEKFLALKQQLQVLNTRNLSLDDQMKWNTTYEMLLAASELKDVFSCLDTLDPDYSKSPSGEDWKFVDNLCTYLKLIFDTANLLTSSSVPTANNFFHEAWKLQLELTRASTSEDKIVTTITKPMIAGFDKYWKSSCLVLAIAVVMDPRFKMKLVEFSFTKLYGDEAETYINIVDEGIHQLFLEYTGDVTGHLSNGVGHAVTEFDEYIMQSISQQSQSELDQYLEESLLPRVHGFDVMGWWKLNKSKYPTLSKMAHDILTVPVSTVDPESVFDTGMKEMDRCRCTLRPETVEALYCAKDWLRSEIFVNMDSVVKMEFPI